MKRILFTLLLSFFTLSYAADYQEPPAELSDEALVAWVAKVTPIIGQLDYQNYDQQLAKSQQFFSEKGWKKVQREIKKNNIDSYVHNQRAIVTTSVKGSPKITKSFSKKGVAYQTVSTKISVHFRSSYMRYSQPLLASFDVKRVVDHFEIQSVHFKFKFF